MKYMSVLCILVLSVFSSIAYSAEKDTVEPGAAPFIARIPEGLYLAPPGEEFHGKYAPLFIVKDGRLIDPYAALGGRDTPRDRKAKTLKAVLKEHAAGKRFGVWAGERRIGKMTGLKLEIRKKDDTCRLIDGEDIAGIGHYEGLDFKKLDPDARIYVKGGKRDSLFYPDSGWRPVAAPESFVFTGVNAGLTVTEAEVEKALNAADKTFLKVSRASLLSKLAKERPGVEIEILDRHESELRFLRAVDMDGNWLRDFIGEYAVLLLYKERGLEDDFIERHRDGRSIFISDTGKVEDLIDGSKSVAVLWLVDMDGDGFKELVIETSEDAREDINYAYEPYIEKGRRIEVLRHTPSGWVSVYRTVVICERVE